MISLMTLHGAKGLEFDIVFLPGWEEGVFPSQRTIDESGIAGLEEERRLAYVGITRARQRAFISHAANRQIFRQLDGVRAVALRERAAGRCDRKRRRPGTGAVAHQNLMAEQFSTQFNQMAKRIPARMPVHAEPSSFSMPPRGRARKNFMKKARASSTRNSATARWCGSTTTSWKSNLTALA